MNVATNRRSLGTEKRRTRRAGEGAREDPGSRVGEVWRAVTSDPYVRLPEGRIELRDVLRLRTIRDIYRSARRTLQSDADLLPPFDKLVHPVGICLRGTWRISEPNPYTGYFRQGSEGLLIARASDNMGENRPGRLRFLGLAGKLYPTRDPDDARLLRPADFVMNESMMGTHTKHFVDATLATDLLPFDFQGELRIKHVLGGLVAALFAVADRGLNLTQSLIRQLYPIAELGEPAPDRALAPAVMRFVSAPQNRRVHTPELREELQMRRHPEGIRYAIEVSDRRSYWVAKGFRRIGEVHFTESMTSCTCDQRLHFRHAPYRKNIP